MSDIFQLSRFVRVARSRLCWRIALSVFASIIVIEGAILVPSYRNYERDRLDRLQFAGANAVSEWLRAARPNGEAAALLPSARRMIDSRLLVGGALYHADGRFIGTFGESPHLRPGDEAAPAFHRDRDGTRYERIWTPEDTDAPYIVVGRLDATSVTDDLRHFLFRISGLVLLITAFVSATTMAILGKLVLNPILQLHEKLVQAAHDPANADRFTLPPVRDDELGEVLASFNHMLHHVAGNIAEIAESKASLDELNRSLEQRVEQRTQELEAAIARSGQTNVELRQSERRFRNIFEGSSDAIVLIGVSCTTFLDVNVAACRLFGYGRSELLALPVSTIYPDGTAELEAFAAVATPGRGHTGSLTCRTKSGADIRVEVSAAIINLGGRAAMLALVRDMTERHRIERAMLSAKEAAESANRAKSEFLANMSHELRTPLNAIIGFSEIMNLQMFGALGDPRYETYAKDIVDSATHLLDIINDILDVSKAEAGKLELHEEEIDLGILIDASVRLVKGRAEADGVALGAEIADSLPLIRADSRKVKQIVINLLSNAIKFTPDGGRVKIEASIAADRSVHIAVIDTGIGMAAGDIAKAMTPFLQIDGALNRKFEGTGLGLPLAKALMELHGGRLTLSSAVGEGTRAVAVFPSERYQLRPETLRRA